MTTIKLSSMPISGLAGYSGYSGQYPQLSTYYNVVTTSTNDMYYPAVLYTAGGSANLGVPPGSISGQTVANNFRPEPPAPNTYNGFNPSTGTYYFLSNVAMSSHTGANAYSLYPTENYTFCNGSTISNTTIFYNLLYRSNCAVVTTVDNTTNPTDFVILFPASSAGSYYKLPDPTTLPGKFPIIIQNTSANAINIRASSSNVNSSTYITLNPNKIGLFIPTSNTTIGYTFNILL